MCICFICKQEYNKLNGRHIYNCAKKTNLNIDKNEIRFLNIQFNTSKSIEYEVLYEKYHTLEYSIREISEYFQISSTDSIFILDYFNIERRNIITSNTTKRRSNLFKETCMTKYGVDNPSKCSSVKQKKEQTFLKNYGVHNIFSVEGIRDIFHNTMIEKYGKGSLSTKNGYSHSVWWKSLSVSEQDERVLKMNLGWSKFWNNLSSDEKEKIIKTRKKTLLQNISSGVTCLSCTGVGSNLEVRINKILQDNSISFTWQKWITNKSYDFHLIDYKILLEINGDYWHAHPSIYKADDLINYPGIKKYAKDVWAADYLKKELAERYGYKVLYIWESDIKKLDDIQLSELVMGLINEN